MATSSLLTEVKAEDLAECLARASQKLDDANGEMLLDFSQVCRIDPAALKALLDLASAAEPKKVKVILRGLNVDVYKVLKLMKLASRFSYVE